MTVYFMLLSALFVYLEDGDLISYVWSIEIDKTIGN
jgi:hypothetical protein